jgi:hypothetical protein
MDEADDREDTDLPAFLRDEAEAVAESFRKLAEAEDERDE